MDSGQIELSHLRELLAAREGVASLVAVAGRVEVYVDGGLRRAPDVVKAIALGARAVLIGRPSLWALATGGSDGVASLLRWYESEMRRTMALCGAATVAQLDRTLVRRAPGFGAFGGSA